MGAVMLTRDLLRFRVSDGVVRPTLLKATPTIVELAEQLLGFWRQGVGKKLGDLEDAAMPLLHQSRALLVARGMQKLITDDCAFADPSSAEAVREQAFAASALALRAPLADVDAHRAAIAAQIGLSSSELMTRLYADLPDQAVLERASTLSAPRLLARYNLSLCQGLLLAARSLDVVIADADTGLRRRLLKALRFRRLLAEVTGDDRGELRLCVSGPASVLDQASRYGLQLALWLPALACARDWRATAEIDLPRRAGSPGGRARLELSTDLGLEGDSAFLGYVPEELADLQRSLADKFPTWTWQDAQLLPMPSGELVVPDLQLAADGGTVAIELFHRWHGHALKRRLDQLASGLAPRLAIGVDRALAKTKDVAPLMTHPAFVSHGFLFSEIPAPRAIAEIVGRLVTKAEKG